jgi:hypothetical protein
VIYLVIRGLGGIAPSQGTPGLVRIRHLPHLRIPLLVRDSAPHPKAASFIALTPSRVDRVASLVLTVWHYVRKTSDVLVTTLGTETTDSPARQHHAGEVVPKWVRLTSGRL